MPKLVFDVETVGVDFDSLDETSQEYFLKYTKNEQEIEDARNSLSFFPVTAQIVAIGMLEVETEKGVVFYQNNSKKQEKFTEGAIEFISGSEVDILNNFWSKLAKYDQFITFSGRAFDGPFVMIRSAIHNIRSTKNLVPYRYDHKMHCDLADQLCFYDAMRRKFSLHMWCKAFGIKSPKEEGMTGLDVKAYFKDGRYQDIARYCMRDIQATKELFLYWDKYLKF